MGSPDLAYTVNGVLVSDFITPNYHAPRPFPAGGAASRARSSVPGTWDWIGRREPTFTRIGVIPTGAGPLREAIDARGELSFLATGLPAGHPQLRVAEERYASSPAASEAHARRLNLAVEALIAGAAAGPARLPEWASGTDAGGGRDVAGGSRSAARSGPEVWGPRPLP